MHIYQATISPQAILRAAAPDAVPPADDTVYRSDWSNRWPGAIAGGQTYFAAGQLRPRQGVGFGFLGAAVPSARALHAVSARPNCGQWTGSTGFGKSRWWAARQAHR